MALAVTRQGSHGPGRACINASGSSADSFASPERVPATIRASYVDRGRSLDVLHLLPSLGSASRRFASLHRVLRGEFPCFNGSIKALRLPAAHPTVLRCLRLAVPQRSLVLFALRWTSAPPKPGVGDPVTPAGISLRRRQDLPSSWGTPISVWHVQSTPAGLRAPDRYSVAAWPLVCEKQRLPQKVFRRSIAWRSDSLSTLRRAGYPATTQDSLPAVGQTLLDGLPPAGFQRKVSERFLTSHPPSPSFAWRNHIARSGQDKIRSALQTETPNSIWLAMLRSPVPSTEVSNWLCTSVNSSCV